MLQRRLGGRLTGARHQAVTSLSLRYSMMCSVFQLSIRIESFCLPDLRTSRGNAPNLYETVSPGKSPISLLMKPSTWGKSLHQPASWLLFVD